MPNDSTPRSLLERIRANPSDRELIGRLLDYCQDYFVCWARRFFGNDQDAEDFLQELFLRVCQEMPRFQYDPERRFRGWLFTMARNLASEMREKRQRQRTNELPSSACASGNGEPEIVEKEFRGSVLQRVKGTIRRDFDPKTWQAFEALTFEGKTVQEVTRAFQMSEAAVYMAKSRVLKRLREEIRGILD